MTTYQCEYLDKRGGCRTARTKAPSLSSAIRRFRRMLRAFGATDSNLHNVKPISHLRQFQIQE